ncbi:hypothetical protein BKA93DRAFT_753189 [Sparassis latifolia]
MAAAAGGRGGSWGRFVGAGASLVPTYNSTENISPKPRSLELKGALQNAPHEPCLRADVNREPQRRLLAKSLRMDLLLATASSETGGNSVDTAWNLPTESQVAQYQETVRREMVVRSRISAKQSLGGSRANNYLIANIVDEVIPTLMPIPEACSGTEFPSQFVQDQLAKRVHGESSSNAAETDIVEQRIMHVLKIASFPPARLG